MIKRDTTFESYKSMLQEPRTTSVTFSKLSNQRCSLDRRTICRSGLTSDNDKVYWLSLGHARPLGHHHNPVRSEPVQNKRTACPARGGIPQGSSS